MEFNKKTLETYERIAEQYANQNNGNTLMKKYHEIMKSFLKKGFIYDIGCGTGRDVQALYELGYNVIGIDGSQKMLEVARENYPNQTFEHCNLLTDIDSLKKADGLWVCASLLHFTNNEFEEVFQSLLSKLKEQGVFYISLKIKNEICNEEIEGRFFQYYKKEFLDEYFNEHNLSILYYEESKNGNNRFANYFLKK